MGPFKLYIGAKLIRAFPEEREGVAGYAVLYPDDYRSWSPKETFESAYREVTAAEKELACVQEVRTGDTFALAGQKTP